MWKKLGIGLGIVLLVLVVGNFAFSLFTGQTYLESRNEREDLKKVDYGIRIVMTAAYLNPEMTSKNATFYIALDTHGGDLFEYDILTLSKLEVNGKTFTPVKWTESSRSWGHHRKGLLEFSTEALKEIESSGSFRLVISGIENDRIFEWRLR
jgi:hypothetical protein